MKTKKKKHFIFLLKFKVSMGINNDFFYLRLPMMSKIDGCQKFSRTNFFVMKSAFSWHMKTCHDLEPYFKKIWHTYYTHNKNGKSK